MMTIQLTATQHAQWKPLYQHGSFFHVKKRLSFKKKIDKRLAARKQPGSGKYQCEVCKDWCDSYRQTIRTFDGVVHVEIVMSIV